MFSFIFLVGNIGEEVLLGNMSEEVLVGNMGEEVLVGKFNAKLFLAPLWLDILGGTFFGGIFLTLQTV